MEFDRSKECKWWCCCPMRYYYEKGQLPEHYIRDYCFGDHLKCIRFQMEESGKYHPDNMLPDGTIDKDLK